MNVVSLLNTFHPHSSRSELIVENGLGLYAKFTVSHERGHCKNIVCSTSIVASLVSSSNDHGFAIMAPKLHENTPPYLRPVRYYSFGDWRIIGKWSTAVGEGQYLQLN